VTSPVDEIIRRHAARLRTWARELCGRPVHSVSTRVLEDLRADITEMYMSHGIVGASPAKDPWDTDE
jgi:hypothetical protein